MWKRFSRRPTDKTPPSAAPRKDRGVGSAPPKTVRVTASFLAVLLAYAAYRALAVPLIEPSASLPGETTGGVEGSFPDPRLAQLEELKAWFQPGDWELERPKVLENPRAKLLFRKFTNKGNGLVEITPCTLIFMPPPGEKSEADRRRQAIVLQAPAGALLQFDKPLDLRTFSIGRLVSGEMRGRITIRSDYRQPGPDDDLSIETRDIVLGAEDISTQHAIQFRLGRNTGSGRGLRLELLPSDEDDGGSQFGPQVAGVRAFSLARDVEMHLEVDGAAGEGIDDADDATQDVDADATEAKTPLEISCRGAFRFDLERQVCTFDDEVDVLGLRPNGPSDHLTCRRLELYFVSDAETAAEGGEAAETSAPSRTTRLKPDRLVALGDPVVITAPVEHVRGRCQRLEYHLVTRQLDLVGTTAPIEFHRRDEEIHARELHYAPGADEAVGRLLVVGPGWLKGRPPDEPAEGGATGRTAAPPPAEQGGLLEIRFARELRSRPLDGEQVVSIVGDAYVSMPDMGALEADEIHAWLLEAPAAERSAAKLRGEKIDRLTPDRMMAQGRVRFDSPQLVGNTDKLEMWFTPELDADAALSGGPQAECLGVALIQGRRPGRSPSPGRSPGEPPETSYVVGPKGQPFADVERREWLALRAARTFSCDPSPQGFALGWENGRPVGAKTENGATPNAECEARIRRRWNTAVAPRLVLAQFREPRDQRQADAPAHDFLSAGGDAAQRVEVSGKLLRVQMRLRGRRPELTEVIIDGDARLTEIATAEPGEAPLRVEGEFLHLVRPSPSEATVVVNGRPPRDGQPAAPALIDGRGLTLLGDAIHLDQGQNRLWIDGAGTMRLLAERDLQDRPLAAPRPVVVTWRGRMNFDGSQAVFERAVRAALDEQVLETESMEVELTQPVDFAQPRQDQRPEVGRVVCRQGVTMTSRTHGEAGLLSREQMQAADLTLDQTSGKMFASGPGWLKQVRFGSQIIEGGLPGGPAAANRPQAAASEGLNYLHVQFQRGMTGNTRAGQITFSDQVRAVYGPVDAWDAVIDPDVPGGLGERGFEMTCDSLTVTQMPRPDAEGDYSELMAEGNAFIEGTTFTAAGQRLTYDQLKDLLVLEGADPAVAGTRRTPAELTFQKRLGGQRSNLTAGRMRYWPGSGRYELDDAREFFNQGAVPGRGN